MTVPDVLHVEYADRRFTVTVDNVEGLAFRCVSTLGFRDYHVAMRALGGERSEFFTEIVKVAWREMNSRA